MWKKDGTNLNLDFLNILCNNYSKFSASIQPYFDTNLRHFENNPVVKSWKRA
jgi:hypothetical protein